MVLFHMALTSEALQKANITVVPPPGPRLSPPAVSLMRDPVAAGKKNHGGFAYARIPSKSTVELDERLHPMWGHTEKALIYHQIGHNVFQAPQESEALFVDIDCFNRQVVEIYENLGGKEFSPYRQQDQQVDGVKVLERLKDEHTLYVVKAAHTGMFG